MRLLAIFALLSLSLTGCARRVEVRVNSLASSDCPPPGKYYLLPAQDSVGRTDLQFQEYARIVDRAMAVRGFTPATEADASQFVLLDYGISEPTERHYSYDVPIIGQTGVSSAYTYGTLTRAARGYNYSGQTTYTPRYGVVGSRNVSGVYVEYTRHALLAAYDAAAYRAGGAIKQLWRAEMNSTGSSGELREIFPILIAAATEHLGTNLPNTKRVSLTSGSPRVKQLRDPSVTKSP